MTFLFHKVKLGSVSRFHQKPPVPQKDLLSPVVTAFYQIPTPAGFQGKSGPKFYSFQMSLRASSKTGKGTPSTPVTFKRGLLSLWLTSRPISLFRILWGTLLCTHSISSLSLGSSRRYYKSLNWAIYAFQQSKVNFPAFSGFRVLSSSLITVWSSFPDPYVRHNQFQKSNKFWWWCVPPGMLFLPSMQLNLGPFGDANFQHPQLHIVCQASLPGGRLHLKMWGISI